MIKLTIPPSAAGDAEPSKHTSHGYEKGKREHSLRWVGVDSLYLSFYGDLFPMWIASWLSGSTTRKAATPTSKPKPNG